MWDKIVPILVYLEIKQRWTNMSPENASKLWGKIQEAGLYLRS